METEGSDNEFWKELNHIEAEEPAASMQQLSMNLVDLISSKIDQRTVRPPVSIALDKNSREYFEDKIERIRESKEEEIQATKIKISNKLKRQYESIIEKTKQKYQKKIFEYQKEVASLKSQLQLRDISINHLCSLISDMESYMINARIITSQARLPIKPADSLIDESLIYQVQVQNSQISNLKETCESYLLEIDKMNKKKSEIQENYLKKEQSLKKEIEKLQAGIKSKESELEAKTKKMQHEFERFKREINVEQAAKDLLVDRQRQHIEVLKEELKNAKIVLQSRKLRNKFYEKLDDYMKEVEPAHRKHKSEMPSRNTSAKFKTIDSRTVQKGRRSEMSSPNSRVFVRKVSSPNSLTIDFTVTNSWL